MYEIWFESFPESDERGETHLRKYERDTESEARELIEEINEDPFCRFDKVIKVTKEEVEL